MIYETYIKESKIIDKTDEEKSLDLVKSLIKNWQIKILNLLMESL